jgi:hypothetical protein
LAQNATTILWLFGDGVSTTLPNPFHLYPGSGCYLVTQIAMNSCANDTLERYVALGVDQDSCGPPSAIDLSEPDYQIQLFPNPNNGTFTLIFDKDNQPDRLEIYNSLGQLIYSLIPENDLSNSININLNNATTGVYLLMFEKGKNRITKRFVIK